MTVSLATGTTLVTVISPSTTAGVVGRLVMPGATGNQRLANVPPTPPQNSASVDTTMPCASNVQLVPLVRYWAVADFAVIVNGANGAVGISSGAI